MTWSDVYESLRPHDHWLNPEVLFLTESPFLAITNPYTSATDVNLGREIFESTCATCHAERGDGAGPNLSEADFKQGGSDWALFRTVSCGVPNSPMGPTTLGAVRTWQLVAFVQSLRRGTGNSAPIDEDISGPAITYERLLRAEEDHDWLTYSGSFNGHRHRTLKEVDRSNVRRLSLMWAHQISTEGKKIQMTPLVVSGVMYLTEPPNNVVALDAKTGEIRWTYRRKTPERLHTCCGAINRGLAVRDGMLFMGTLDAHLIALDAKRGTVIWDTVVADADVGYSITAAPLALKNIVVTGVSGGDFGTRGFLDAYNYRTGERVWRFYTTPKPREPGADSWSGDSWKTGGAATWMTGSFDPDLNLLYWGTGNPAPDYEGDVRKGDNLYANSVIAIDVDSGQLRWHFQFTPHDEHDWDSNQIPVLVDSVFKGRPRKLMLLANKNAFYYVLDRETGEYLVSAPFSKQTWAASIDSAGRPIERPDSSPSQKGTLVYPGVGGAANWWSPSYNPATGLLYIPVSRSWDIFTRGQSKIVKGEWYLGGDVHGQIESASVRAIEPLTGELKWEFEPTGPAPFQLGGLLSTAGNLVFGAIGQTFFALDAETGEVLWKIRLGGNIEAAPVSYQSSGRQQVTISAGRTVYTFGLATD